MSYRVSHDDDTSRKVIDQAIGILVGLRGCSPDEAFAELVRVVHRTGIGIGSLAGALVALAGGNSRSTAEHIEAFNAWGELIRRTQSVSLAAAP
ncbi:MAG: hypothetical protein QOC69_5019 [Mycobacterium sp.]|jgi:hypothetical protein|nr:hypothetical protein [Mycobacterium sp.]